MKIFILLIVIGFLVISGFMGVKYITNTINTRETEAEDFLNAPYNKATSSPRPSQKTP
jgi:hypothetical protein